MQSPNVVASACSQPLRLSPGFIKPLLFANATCTAPSLTEQWSPALSIKTAMLSVQALLSSPEPNDPQDAVVARQYMVGGGRRFESRRREPETLNPKP